MADNVTSNPGAGGYVFATDDIGGVHYPITKVSFGALETATLVSPANPLPVSLHANGNPFAFATGGAATLGDYGVPALVKRRDADSSVSADGQYMTLNCDEEGRVKVATKPASYAPTTGTITANGQTVFVDCSRFSNLMIHCKGTFSTVNVTFEGSLDSTNGTDGTWFAVQAIRSNANTIETTTGNLSAAPAYAWELSVNALKYFRVRATAWTSGTQTWTMIPGTYATEPIPGAQVTSAQAVTLTSTTVTASTPATPTASNISSAATTNATSVKNSAGTAYSVTASNTGASPAYVKLYNKASAPTVGTDVPVLTMAIPASGTVNVSFGSQGHRFATGIALAITNGAADSDTAAVAAAQVKVLTSYI
jgi:hypothetical protein